MRQGLAVTQRLRLIVLGPLAPNGLHGLNHSRERAGVAFWRNRDTLLPSRAVLSAIRSKMDQKNELAPDPAEPAGQHASKRPKHPTAHSYDYTAAAMLSQLVPHDEDVRTRRRESRLDRVAVGLRHLCRHEQLSSIAARGKKDVVVYPRS